MGWERRMIDRREEVAQTQHWSPCLLILLVRLLIEPGVHGLGYSDSERLIQDPTAAEKPGFACFRHRQGVRSKLEQPGKNARR